jgi:hypothetical protein
MLVYIQSNYSYPDLLRQTPFLNGIWDDIQFTFEEVEKCDYIIVINHPIKDINIKCRKGGRILFIQEPPYEKNNYLIPYFPFFDTIITAFDKKYSSNIINTQAALPWLIDKNYKQLVNLSFNDTKKNDRISWITSNSNINPGHAPRLKFLEKIKQTDLNIDIFGRGIRHIDDKFDAIYPYKYTLAIENYSDTDYWTEKISDAFLTWTMPIYYGCTNIEKFFPENSFVKIDIYKPEESFEIIKKCLIDKLYDKNIQAIKEARDLVLNKYQLFPLATEIINNSINKDEKLINCFIPLDPNSISFIRKIKLLMKIK